MRNLLLGIGVFIVAILAIGLSNSPGKRDSPPSAEELRTAMAAAYPTPPTTAAEPVKPLPKDFKLSPADQAEFDKLGISAWSYRSSKDEMRGTVNRWAFLDSENKVELERPYDGGSTLSITVRSMPKVHGNDVLLILSKGQLGCSYSGCKISVKFDDGNIIQYSASEAQGGGSDTIFIDSHEAFLKRLRAAKTVRIEVPMWRHGGQQFVFKPAGLEWK